MERKRVLRHECVCVRVCVCVGGGGGWGGGGVKGGCGGFSKSKIIPPTEAGF